MQLQSFPFYTMENNSESNSRDFWVTEKKEKSQRHLDLKWICKTQAFHIKTICSDGDQESDSDECGFSCAHTHTLCTAPDYVFYQIVKKYQHASHAVICMHVWFWISWLFKYAVRNSPALPPALSRCTLTLSLVLIELFRFKASFAMERGNSQKYLNCKNASSSKEGGKIQGNLSELETPPPPSSTLENPQHTAQKRQHIHSVSSALPANLPCPNLCNRIWHILQRIVGDEKKKKFNLRREP